MRGVKGESGLMGLRGYHGKPGQNGDDLADSGLFPLESLSVMLHSSVDTTIRAIWRGDQLLMVRSIYQSNTV